MILRRYSTGLEFVTKKISQIQVDTFWKNSKGKILDQFTSPKNSVFDHAKLTISSPIAPLKDDLFMYVDGEQIEYDRTKMIRW